MQPMAVSEVGKWSDPSNHKGVPNLSGGCTY